MTTKHIISRAALVSLGGVLILTSQACGGAPAATPTPIVIVATSAPVAVAATSTPGVVAGAPPTATVVQPAATTAPLAAPSPTLAPATSAGQVSSGAPDRLKPVEPTKAANVVPAAQPAEKAPSSQPAVPRSSRFLIPSLAKAATPTPVPAPARKGVASESVDPEQYAEEVVTDLMMMADSVGQLSELLEQVDAEAVDDAQVEALLTQHSAVLAGVYQRQVARDYPPALKQIDDYYAETTRYASRTVDSLLKLFQTGDEQYVAEVEEHVQKFEFFLNELVKLVE